MVGTLEEAVDMKKSRRIQGEMTETQKGMVGKSCRVNVPLADPVSLRYTGDFLCGLGERLKALSQRGDMSPAEVLLLAYAAIRDADRRIQHKIYGTPLP
jgi:hypothetical protein